MNSFFGKKKNPVLIHTTETGKPKTIRLRESVVTLGKSKKATVRIGGDYVSDEHAKLIVKTDGSLHIENLSPNGTILNGVNVEQSDVRNGDVLQIGSSNSFVVDGLAETTANLSLSEDDQTGEENQQTKETTNYLNWKYLLGGVVWLGVVGFFAVSILSENPLFNTESSDLLTLDSIDEAVRSSVIYLGNRKNIEISDSDVEKMSLSESPRQMSYDNLWSSEDSGEDHIIWIKEMSVAVRTNLVNAFWLDQQGRVQESIEVLEDVVRMVPDIENPAALYSLAAISHLQNTLQDEQ